MNRIYSHNFYKKLNMLYIYTLLLFCFSSAAIAAGPNFNDTSQQTIAPNAAGNVGIGTFQYSNRFNIEGGVAIGTYGTTNYVNSVAPFGGMIVQANVGIGSVTPGTALDVNGTARMTGFTLSNNGVAAGNVMVTNAVGVGTWMAVEHVESQQHQLLAEYCGRRQRRHKVLPIRSV